MPASFADSLRLPNPHPPLRQGHCSSCSNLGFKSLRREFRHLQIAHWDARSRRTCTNLPQEPTQHIKLQSIGVLGRIRLARHKQRARHNKHVLVLASETLRPLLQPVPQVPAHCTQQAVEKRLLQQDTTSSAVHLRCFPQLGCGVGGKMPRWNSLYSVEFPR